MELYHITDRRNIPSILKNGLTPRIGNRSMQLENEPIVCLTERQYLPFWKILLSLSHPAVLKVTIDPNEFDDTVRCEQNYFLYKEIRIKTNIPPECIQKATVRIPHTEMTDTMKKLCKSYLYEISAICIDCAREYTEHVKTYLSKQDMIFYLESLYKICSRLDYSVMTTDEKRAALIEIGESGEFTFLDTYQQTDKKLYQLTMFKDPYTYCIRRRLEEWIADTFHDCLDITTGGWDHVQ